ncbi:MAG: right-handed parallel beta-helix repeat-containing protein, partial [Bacillota bacterium]
MKRFILLHLCLVVSLLCLTDISAQSNLRKWTETSVEEFSRGKLQDVIITNLSGGEIQLPAPLIKTSQDTNENNEPVFEAKDNAGNSFRTWVSEGNVYVQKYSSAGKALTSAIAVNDTPGIAGKDGVSRVAAFDDGSFIVVWADLNSYALDPQERMFAQVFRNDSIKVKNNFQINHLKNGSGCYPVVIANKYDSNFWIFTSLYQGQNYRLFAQKRDKNGNLIGEIFSLNNAPLTKAEMRPAAVWDGNGFSIAWEGFDSNVSTYVDIYIECFNPDGTIRRSAVKVNDDVGPFMQASASICADTKGNILVAFVDARLTTPKEYNGVDNIFGQLFNPSGNKVGSNIRLENSPYIYNVSPQISCENGEFIISWTIYDNSNQRYLYYKNRWKADPKSSGTFTSGIFNSGPSGTELKELSWTDSLSGGSNILFKLRSAPSVEALINTPWYGPADTMSYYTVSSGSKINLQNNSGRYVQYKAILETADGISPILKSVTINYLPADTIPPLVPSGLTAKSGHSSNSINWERNPEKDLAFYVIYRGKTSRQYDPGWRKVVSYYKTSFIDSSAVSGNKYYYVITSLDSSGNESGFSNEVSAVPYGINIYVSKTGNAGASGTIDDPFGNITSAINAAMFGDTVRVLPGSYDEIFTMRNGVSLIGTNVETCLLKAKYLDAADSLIIKNLTFTGFLTCLNVSPVITGNIFRQADPNGAAIRALQDANPVIINNFITECEAGILIPFDSAPVIKNNIIQTHGVAIDIGIQAKPQVINNTILFTEHFGIRLIMSDAAV